MPTDDPQILTDILTRVRVIALVGASDKTNRPSNEVMAYLQGRGYRVIPVNPRLAGGRILGEQVFGSLSEIGEKPDMVDLFLNPDRVGPVVDEAIALGAPVVWMQLGVVNPEAAARAEQAGLTVVMDHCPKQEIPRLGVPPVQERA